MDLIVIVSNIMLDFIIFIEWKAQTLGVIL